MQTRSRQDGFTLIELMIVMVVLGILAGIILFAVGPFRSSATNAGATEETRTLLTANAAYRVTHGTDAPDANALLADGLISSAPKYVSFANGVVTPINPATTTTLSPTSSTSTTSASTTSTTVQPTVRISSLTGSTSRSGNSNNFSVTVNVTVTDANSAAVSGVVVSGSWNDAAAGTGCTTTAGGTCSFSSNHSAPDTSTARTWTVSSVTKAGYGTGTNVKSSLACRRSGSNNGTTACT